VSAVPSFLLRNEHAPADCAATFAAWIGFDSPLRHTRAPSSCLAGGHELWWRVDAADAGSALELLPRYLRSRTRVARVRDVEIP
jgi:hypothetical protein